MVEHYQRGGHCFDLMMVIKSWVTRSASSSGQELKTNMGLGSELEQFGDAQESSASTIENSFVKSCENTRGFLTIGKNVALIVWYTELK